MTNHPIRVVVADDEPDVRTLLRLQLEGDGFAVVGEAADGAEAIELCTANAPDAVVIDLLMPGTTGFEAIATLQQSQPTLAIVAYTAVAGDFVRSEMERLRVPLLLKSGDPTTLTTKLRELVGLRPN